jgi:hypothetical protein
MTEIYQNTITQIRLSFWRCLASILGWIIRWKSGYYKPISYAPYIIAGIASYFAGKAFAGLILRVILS